MAEAEKLPENYLHIVRIANVDIPGARSVHWGLTHIKGIGINFADVICAATGVDRNCKVGTLKPVQIDALSTAISNPAKVGIPSWLFNRRRDVETGEDIHLVTGNLNFIHDNDLKLLKKIKCYRGIRHIKGLPVRGQRTRSNFRRAKGKVVGVVKKKVAPGAAAPATAGGKKEKDKK